jgi:type VI secretion system ImpA family protein
MSMLANRLRRLTGAKPTGTPAWRRLLEPVPGARATGAAARHTGDYQRIEEARRQDDPALPQGVWQHDLKHADWALVARACAETLEQRSKDLQVAAWLLEARLHEDGLAALPDALALLHGLCERYWADLYPEIDADGDISARLAPFEWLNDKLPPLLYEMPITCSSDEARPQSWTDYSNAQRLERLRLHDARQAERAEARGALGLAVVQAAIDATPDEFYQRLAGTLDDAERALAGLQAEMDRRCGSAGISLANVHTAIVALRAFARTVLKERGAPQMPEPLASDLVPEDDGQQLASAEEQALPAEPAFATTSGLSIHSREEAYRLLAEIADYLHHTEPHSPTPYLIQRAVGWGTMPLHALLMELSRGRQDLSLLFELLGLDQPDAKNART